MGLFDKFSKDINDKLGANTVRQAINAPDKTVIDSGIFALDYALCGGISEYKIALGVGWEQSNKTSTGYRLIATVQEKYPDDGAVLIETENVFDKLWAEQLGIDLERLYITYPPNAQKAVDIAIASMEEPRNRFIMVDSLAMFTPDEVIKASASDFQMGLESRINSKFLNVMMVKLMERQKKGLPLTVYVINQYSQKIGVLYGDNRSIGGGNKQRFAAETIIDFKAIKEHTVNTKKRKEDGLTELVITDSIEKAEFGFTIKKFRGSKIKEGEYVMALEAHLDLPMGAIDDYMTVLGYAKKHGVVYGRFNIHGIDRTFKSGEEMRVFLIENPLEYKDLKAKVIACRRKMLGLPTLPPDNYLMRYQEDPADMENLSHVEGQQEGDEVQIPSSETLEETGAGLG